MQRAHTPPLFKQWFPWLVLTFVVANVVLFMVTMYVNDYPKHSLHPASCFVLFLGRFSFQPLKQNPLFGPSSYPSSNQNRKVYISKVNEVGCSVCGKYGSSTRFDVYSLLCGCMEGLYICFSTCWVF
ncbi:hypothetical protein P8452_38004 [Trifolium repens]|nr:hypothetical protein P8452_38004 [Trifolium repens]